ncbi:hypothetical protein ACNOYE_07715 [Nannocystaceae bacterium ST9]
MKFVFDSGELIQGLLAPVERCFSAALDELGLEPVVDEPSEPPAIADEPPPRPPAIERPEPLAGSREPDLAGRPRVEFGKRSRESADESNPSPARARKSPGEGRLRIRSRDAASSDLPRSSDTSSSRAATREPSPVEPSPTRSVAIPSVAERETEALAAASSRVTIEPRVATGPSRASVELPATPANTSARPSESTPSPTSVEPRASEAREAGPASPRSGFDPERVAELLARRIGQSSASAASTGRVNVQPRASEADEITLAGEESSGDEDAASVESPLRSPRESASPRTSGSTSGSTSASSPSPASSTATSPAAASPASTSSPSPSSPASSRPDVGEPSSSRQRLRVRPRSAGPAGASATIDAQSIETSLVGEPGRDPIAEPLLDARPFDASASTRPTPTTTPTTREPRSLAHELAHVTPTHAGEPELAARGRAREGRIPVVARAGAASQALDEAALESPTSIASEPTPTPSSNTGLPGNATSLRASHPRALELVRARATSSEPATANTTSTTPSTTNTATSARGSSSSSASAGFAPPAESLSADPLDPNLERTLTTVLRNAARRQGIDV